MKNLVKELHEKAKEAAKRFHRAESDLINILQELDRHRVFEALGFTSLFKYAVEELRLSDSNAYNFITVARKSREIPEIKEEIRKGNLTVCKARKITSVINKRNSAQWLEMAKTLPQKKLEKEVARVNPKAATPDRAKYVAAERVELTMGISEETMEKLKRAQNVLSQKKKRAVSLEEVLDQTLETYLHKEDPLEKAKRNASREQKPKSLPVARQVGFPGRKPMPAQVKHNVILRDRGKCSKPGCDSQRHLEMHHVIPVSRGGEHQIDNLELLCSAHHRMWHTG